MRFRFMLAVFALALTGDAGAKTETKFFRTVWSRGAIASRALQKGAVYEQRLRLKDESIQDYLAQYTRWFLPVDQLAGSGRKLISVLSREHGDQYNIVFLYSYEDAYKHNYYCQYRKAFFDYHSQEKGATHDEFLEAYTQAVEASGGARLRAPEMLKYTVAALRADCTEDKPDQPDLAEDTIMRIGAPLAAMIQLDEGTWNFGVNLCEVAKIVEARPKPPGKKDPAPPDAVKRDAEKPKACPESMLERATSEELKWPKLDPARR
jgi:hypothetical protein